MLSILAKDEQNGIWFKSDQYLTEITDAFFFYVTKSWFREKYTLWARQEVRYYSYVSARWETKNRDFKIGIYRTAPSASIALEEVMKFKNINPM